LLTIIDGILDCSKIEAAEVTFYLMYWPEEKYDGVIAGATFTLREGPKIVGFGQVLSDIEPPMRRDPRYAS
jgi:hypothetical protein